MKSPHYQDDLVTLYHGDCMEILPTLGQFDMVFTSPPYNLNCPEKPGGGFSGTETFGKWTKAARGGGLGDGYSDHGDDMPLDDYEAWQRSVLAELWEHTAGAIFYNHKPRPWLGEVWLPLRLNPDLPLRQVIIWVRAGGINFSPSHYCPTHEWIMVFARPDWRLKSKAASGLGDVWREAQEPNEHPAPFPVGLPARAIETVAPLSVLDPFAGSGSTLRAAKNAGVRSVGIEKSERYCDMAVRRLAQEALAL